MLKRGLFYTIIIAAICLATFHVYKDNETQTVIVPLENITFDTTPNYTADNIDEYIINSEKPVNVLFYDSYDTNSIYLLNNILPALLEKRELPALPDFVFCDLTGFETETNGKNRWGFFECPAIASLQNNSGTIETLSILTWDASHSITVDSIENWMINNGLLSN